MKFTVVIFSFLCCQLFAQSPLGKWKIKTESDSGYVWTKVTNDSLFSGILDKIAITENGEYILRSGDYKKSGLAELSFGYWKQEKDRLLLTSKFGDVLMYEFRIVAFNENEIKIKLLYSFE